MNARPQGDECKGCAISRNDPKNDFVRKILSHGSILKLKHKWVLHHYKGSEGFLGWLTLQTEQHRERLSSLSDDQAKGFGQLLKAIDEGLHEYWENEFPEDPLERVYVGCFFEYSKHLHLHIVPRPKSFRKLAVCTMACSVHEQIEKEPRWPHGWHVYLVSKCHGFPDRYRMDKRKTKKLMRFLETKLPLA